MKQLLILFLCGLSFSFLGQKKPKKIELKGISGTAIMRKTENEIQCEKRAIQEAKVEALRQAGVSENISSFTSFIKQESDGKYEEIFKSNFLNDINGHVVVNQIHAFEKTYDQWQNKVIKARIDVTVLKFDTEKDLTFTAKVEGIRSTGYLSSEKVEFTITPNRNMYVRIFDIVNNKSYPVYPNALEPDKLLIKGEKQSFPTTNQLNYEFVFDGQKESHNFMIVMLKEDIPYNGSEDPEKVLEWLFNIPPNERKIEAFTFDVLKAN